MLKAKNIIYGYCTYTTPNKPKYLISLYRSDTLNIVAVFPTSRKRLGVLLIRSMDVIEKITCRFRMFLTQTGL